MLLLNDRERQIGRAEAEACLIQRRGCTLALPKSLERAIAAHSIAAIRRM